MWGARVYRKAIEKTSPVLHALAITVIAILLTVYLIYDFSSLSIFAPMEQSMDFQLSDVYSSVANSRPMSEMSDDVVIVSTNDCDRKQIAQIIEMVDYFAPSAIALDIFFPHRTLDDNILFSAVNNCDNIVLPYSLRYNANSDSFSRGIKSFFDDSISGKSYGVINLAVNSVRDVVREFRPSFKVEDTVYNNFMAEVARIAQPDKYAILQQRNSETETIYFPSRQFDIITPEEIIGDGVDFNDLEQRITGKSVLIGILNDINDEHITPTEPNMSGILIHAHALDTILNERYIKTSPKALNWAIAILLCFGFALFNIYTKDQLNNIGGLLIRIAQFGIMYLFALWGCWYFAQFNTCLDFSQPLLMIGFGAVAFDIWFGMIALILGCKEWWSNRLSKIFKRQN